MNNTLRNWSKNCLFSILEQWFSTLLYFYIQWEMPINNSSDEEKEEENDDDYIMPESTQG